MMVTLASAIVLDNKQIALDYFENYKIQREQSISNQIIITTNKICSIEYESEEITCQICYILEGETLNRCVEVPEGSTLTQDQDLIRDDAKDLVHALPIEQVEYIEREMEGQIINQGKLQ